MVVPRLDCVPGSNPLATDLTRRTALRGLGGGLAAILWTAGARRAAAQEATLPTLPPVLAEWVAVWAAGLARAATLYTADAILEDASSGEVFPGREEVQAHVAAEFDGFPGHAYAVPVGFVAGDWAAAEWVFIGTLTGTYPGLPPGTGQAVSLRGAALFRLAGGQIHWEVHCYDAYAFLVQLGLLPGSSATEATPAP